ncbi:phosphotransferase family protein [Mycolicibacterium hippocampi]|uniref:Aminoglycoside phosphotransferase n=1 Tax=Mycolicibacterium hippocampi TaxID=659824 RepID=A0A7I9ZJG5_9MYCO|nr:phosphotransferase family protein [Mycolicibacterium hippocampi]GFH00986.1 aminoglycoside phosphotransferase [Mycolicibacterium hippocampi]
MAELDVHELRARLSTAGVSNVLPLAGGASSLTFQGTVGDRPVVVKVATPGRPPVGHRDVLRQARMIRALRATNVPVPEVLWRDVGAPPDTPPLFVMSMVEGTSFEPLFDTVEGPPKTVVSERYHKAAKVLAMLHELRPAALGYAGEPVLGAAAEIDRWCATLRTVDPAWVPGWPETSEALRSCVPAAMAPAVVHGDFRLGNLLAVDTDITAVIDWEIWSVGDPRIDLGWFLVNADPNTYRRPGTYVDAVPAIEQLAADYGDMRGVEVPDLAWFMALACFKSAATWALIVKHNRRSSSPRPELEAMAPVLPALLSRARALLD